MSLLEVNNLKIVFKVPDSKNGLKAVDDVSFNLDDGECLGLVGESGCGKSTLGNSIIKLVPINEGSVKFNGANVSTFKGNALKDFRKQVQMIFQDPFGSLNPRISVGSSIAEVLKVHGCYSRNEVSERVCEILKLVELDPDYASRYPHEFSGGQRQRICIARALAVNPSLIIADEAVSALDVSVQVQVLNLMKDLQEKMNLSYLFIAHDLAVVRYMCSRILVMYLGKIVESAPANDLYNHPAHPYTEALLSAVPDVEKGLHARSDGGSRIILQGDVPSPIETIKGCPFHPRCIKAKEICSQESPPTVHVSDNHVSVCHFAS